MATLKETAEKIRDEQGVSKNTAERVGGLLVDIVKKLDEQKLNPYTPITNGYSLNILDKTVYFAKASDPEFNLSINSMLDGVTSKIVIQCFTDKSSINIKNSDNSDIVAFDKLPIILTYGKWCIIDVTIADNKPILLTHTSNEAKGKAEFEFTIPNTNIITNAIYLEVENTRDLDIYISWGDGQIERFNNTESAILYLSYAYQQAGKYTVRILDEYANIRSMTFDRQSTKVVSGINEFVMPNIIDLPAFCSDQQLLQEIKADLVCPNLVRTYDTFYNCKNLVKIPSTIINTWTKATNIEYLFQNTGLTDDQLTETFFDSLVNVEVFVPVTGTKITYYKKNWFKNKPNMVNLSGFGYHTQSVTTADSDTFMYCGNVINAGHIYNFCSLKTLPEGIFKYFVNCESLEWCLSRNPLDKLHADLFKYNPKLKTIYGAFYGTIFDDPTVPETLISHLVNLEHTDQLFEESNIKYLPNNFYVNNPNIKTMSRFIKQCPNLTNDTIVKSWFANKPNLTDISRAFMRTKSFKYFEVGVFDDNIKLQDTIEMCYECTNLEIVPANIFAKATLKGDARKVFYKCSNLTMNINDFAQNTNFSNITDISDYFNGCTKIQGSGINFINKILLDNPNIKHTGVFKDCTILTDYSSIPSDWK